MTDYFELLDQDRKPWLDTELIEQAFLAASTTHHPDRVHEASEAERHDAHRSRQPIR
jgi:DnaJ-class molecular chaperone